jgi:AcrR family transcriptional regulator
MAERLSRERILDVASRLAADDGLETLSMRRIAQQLDVWPMSLYRHFQDKDALLDALAARAAPGPRANAGLRELVTEVRDVVARQPAGMGDRLPHVLDAPAMRELRAAGEQAAGSAEGWRTLETYALGAAVRGLGDAEFEEGLDLLLAAVS